MNYPALLREIIGRIRQGQVRAAVSVNVELLALYWDVGRMIAQRQNDEGWGAAVIPRLANDIKNGLTDIKGFSERNLKRMLAFYKEYSDLEIVPRAVAQIDMKNDTVIVPRAVAQLPEATSANLLEYIIRLPWAQNVILLQIKDRKERLWYMRQSLENGWSRDFLSDQIKFDLYNRQGKAVSNFDLRLPEPQSSLAQETLKNPYVFDFLTLDTTFHEKELEDALIADVEKFLLELGAGFAFIGRQYHLSVGDDDFYIDLLFYHAKLHCYVVIELKNDKFKPEFAGKTNFYCSVVDGTLKQENDNPTIGLILCRSHNRVVAEYTLKNIDAAIGVSDYQLTRDLPDNFKSCLPTVEEIEERLDEQQ